MTIIAGFWSTLGIFGVIAIVVIVLAILWIIGAYNGLVKLRNRYRNAFAQIDVQLKRRHDLIPNLVETAKGYLKHESETLEAVIAARNAAETAREGISPDNAEQMGALMAAEGGLGSVLGRLFALSEAYPDLKANQNMMQFQEELASTENKVAFSRQAFNDSVMSYNNSCQNFPGNLVANNFGFKAAEFLDIEEGKHDVPEVSFQSTS